MENETQETEPQTAHSTPTRAKRWCFANGERMAIVRNVKRHIALGESIRKVCQKLKGQGEDFQAESGIPMALSQFGIYNKK
jgi:hypothetical protein